MRGGGGKKIYGFGKKRKGNYFERKKSKKPRTDILEENLSGNVVFGSKKQRQQLTTGEKNKSESH